MPRVKLVPFRIQERVVERKGEAKSRMRGFLFLSRGQNRSFENVLTVEQPIAA